MLDAEGVEDGRDRIEAHASPAAAGSRFLMCAPRHFAVSYSINPWMDPQAWSDADGQVAEQQWAALQRALLAQGAGLEFVDPLPDFPDLVFAANAAVVLDDKALLARFRHPERQGEEPVYRAAFLALQARGHLDQVVELPEGMWLEGAGDCIFDPWRQQFWMGFGPRSHAGAAQTVTAVFGVKCVALELADPHFYHLDTAFCALPSGDVIYYPGAFTASGRGAIAERVAHGQRIELDRDEANEFAANAVPFDHCIVLSSCSARLRAMLGERGFTVVTTPLQAFQRSGGSACCLTLRLDHRSNRMSPA